MTSVHLSEITNTTYQWLKVGRPFMYPLEIVLHVYSFCQLESCELIRINFV